MNERKLPELRELTDTFENPKLDRRNKTGFYSKKEFKAGLRFVVNFRSPRMYENTNWDAKTVAKLCQVPYQIQVVGPHGYYVTDIDVMDMFMAKSKVVETKTWADLSRLRIGFNADEVLERLIKDGWLTIDNLNLALDALQAQYDAEYEAENKAAGQKA